MKKLSKKYESIKGKYRVVVKDGETILEVNGSSLFTIDDVKDLTDLFIAVASVLNQIYDDDHFQ